MQFEWVRKKAKRNYEKHRVSFKKEVKNVQDKI
jgi:uncharacterized DUF497 family protein